MRRKDGRTEVKQYTPPPPLRWSGGIKMFTFHTHLILLIVIFHFKQTFNAADVQLPLHVYSVLWTKRMYTFQTLDACAEPGFYVRGCTSWRGVGGPPRSPAGPGQCPLGGPIGEAPVSSWELENIGPLF